MPQDKDSTISKDNTSSDKSQALLDKAKSYVASVDQAEDNASAEELIKQGQELQAEVDQADKELEAKIAEATKIVTEAAKQALEIQQRVKQIEASYKEARKDIDALLEGVAMLVAAIKYDPKTKQSELTRLRSKIEAMDKKLSSHELWLYIIASVSVLEAVVCVLLYLRH